MQIVRRKWGYYITLISRANFKVKLLRFSAGKSCSLQYHNKRDELWLFLSGCGEMQVSNSSRMIGKGQYAVVRQRAWHQYTAKKKTWVLELQFGIKCEENDIVRAA